VRAPLPRAYHGAQRPNFVASGHASLDENEVRARQRLQVVIPVVLLVIYLLLYLTYGSFLAGRRSPPFQAPCVTRCTVRTLTP
jgi:hypothetical protein